MRWDGVILRCHPMVKPMVIGLRLIRLVESTV